MAFTQENLVGLIKVAAQNGASDIHIRTDETPCLRIRGELYPVQTKVFSIQDVQDIISLSFSLEKLKNVKLEEGFTEADGGFEVKDICRIRYNIFKYNSKFGIVFRIINTKIPNLKDLNLSPAIKEIANQRRGLILVTGETGSGKSTTLAAIINEINQTRSAHIVTIEDPIEYLHPQIKSRVTQREIGKDTLSFSTAMRAALRQDPDIILIGEMRDPETVAIALKAAETGHVVYSTVHTTDAISTIGRIISMFSPSEQGEVKKRLADALFATIGQRMLKNSDNSGVVLAQEIMITGPGIKECIKGDEPLGRISSIISMGKSKGGNGSQTFDQHIIDLYNNNQITKETALEAVSSQSDFLQSLIVD